MAGRVMQADDRDRALEELEREAGRLRAALRALVAVEPIVRHGPADYDCFFCNTEGAGSWWAVRPEQVEHSATCPWVRARVLLGGEA
jgi:hypothetical protein